MRCWSSLALRLGGITSVSAGDSTIAGPSIEWPADTSSCS